MTTLLNNIEVVLAKNGKGYHIIGDPSLSEDKILPRVTSITGVLDKGMGLEIWKTKLITQALLNEVSSTAIKNWITEFGFANEGMATDKLDNFLRELENRPLEVQARYIRKKLGGDQAIKTAKMAPENVRKESSDFGSQAHDLLQHLSYDSETSYGSKFEPVVSAWKKWMTETGFMDNILGTEVSLYYDKDGIQFSGTLDLLCQDQDGNLCVIDYKTGNSFNREMVLQVGGGYTLALQHSGNKILSEKIDFDKPMRAIVVKLPKTQNTEIAIKEINFIELQQETFLKLCEVYEWRKNTTNKWVRAKRKN